MPFEASEPPRHAPHSSRTSANPVDGTVLLCTNITLPVRAGAPRQFYRSARLP
jgi:hypothetical protein